ncbi:MAG TPA: glycosyltransferase family 4 protein [Candidatus Angelobacter sp.]
MRITLVISSLALGGAERVMSLLATLWMEQGKEVTLLTLDHGETSAYPIHPGVKRHGLGLDEKSRYLLQGLFRNLKRISVLRRAIRESRPDVVISFMDTINVLTLLATRGLGVPVIVSERIDPKFYNIGPIWSGLRRVTYGFAAALVCQTRSALARFQAGIRVRGYVIPNPVALPPGFAQYQKQQERKTGHVVSAMGRLVPQKGFDILLRAFAQIADRHPDWSLVVMGRGPLKAELELQSNALNLGDRVHFPGEVSDPFAALRAADLFVLSSRFEGFANVLCEAMACGLPVVSFDCPSGPSDIIHDGLDGILVPPQDVDALAAAMDRLMGDYGERTRLASRAPEVLKHFGADRILNMWQELFEELLLCGAVERKQSNESSAIQAMCDEDRHCTDPEA